MRIKLIEELPMATSAELYQLSWVIEQLLADPRRLVQARAQLHTDQQIRYLSWNDGKLRPARVVGMHGDHVAVLDPAHGKAFKVHYAAIHPEPADASTESGVAPADMELTRPSPPREVPARADFRVGNRVTFTEGSSQKTDRKVRQAPASGRSGLDLPPSIFTFTALNVVVGPVDTLPNSAGGHLP